MNLKISLEIKTRTKVVHKNVSQGCHKVRQFYSKKLNQETFKKNENV